MLTFGSVDADLIGAGPSLHVSIGPSREIIALLAPLGNCLIGRDILRYAPLLYEGRKNQFSPSL